MVWIFFIIDELLTYWWRVDLGVGIRPNWKDYLNDLTDVRLIGFQNIDKFKVAVIWKRKGSSFAEYKVTTSIPCHQKLIRG